VVCEKHHIEFDISPTLDGKGKIMFGWPQKDINWSTAIFTSQAFGE
jgi:hypothetical protein